MSHNRDALEVVISTGEDLGHDHNSISHPQVMEESKSRDEEYSQQQGQDRIPKKEVDWLGPAKTVVCKPFAQRQDSSSKVPTPRGMVARKQEMVVQQEQQEQQSNYFYANQEPVFEVCVEREKPYQAPVPMVQMPMPMQMAPPVPAVQDSRESWEARKLVMHGGMLWKIPCTGSGIIGPQSAGKRRWFQVHVYNSDKTTALLQWNDPEKPGKKPRSIRLSQVKKVLTGHQTQPFFSRPLNKIPPASLCFSLMLPERTLDLAGYSVDEVALWLEGINYYAVNATIKQRHISKPSLNNIPKQPVVDVEELIETLFDACYDGDADVFADVLASRQVPIDALEPGVKYGDSCFIIACKLGHVKIAEICLQYGAVNDPHPDYGQTALQTAIASASFVCAKLILETAEASGMNSVIVNEVDHKGTAPIHLAASRKDFFSLQLLLRHGAEIELLDNKGRTVLHRTIQTSGGLSDDARRDRLKCLQLLIDAGADSLINVQDDSGNTALHFAAHTGDVVLLRTLLESAADPLLGNFDQFRPYHIAMSKHFKSCMNLLREYESFHNMAHPSLETEDRQFLHHHENSLNQQQQVVQEQLQQEWVENYTEDGYPYYVNQWTGESQWEDPRDFDYNCIVHAARDQKQPSSAQQQGTHTAHHQPGEEAELQVEGIGARFRAKYYRAKKAEKQLLMIDKELRKGGNGKRRSSKNGHEYSDNEEDEEQRDGYDDTGDSESTGSSSSSFSGESDSSSSEPSSADIRARRKHGNRKSKNRSSTKKSTKRKREKKRKKKKKTSKKSSTKKGRRKHGTSKRRHNNSSSSGSSDASESSDNSESSSSYSSSSSSSSDEELDMKTRSRQKDSKKRFVQRSENFVNIDEEDDDDHEVEQPKRQQQIHQRSSKTSSSPEQVKAEPVQEASHKDNNAEAEEQCSDPKAAIMAALKARSAGEKPGIKPPSAKSQPKKDLLSAQVDMPDKEKYEKYIKMREVGIGEVAVRQKMLMDGITDETIIKQVCSVQKRAVKEEKRPEQDFKSNEDDASGSHSKQQQEGGMSKEEAMKQFEAMENSAKYLRMKKMGIPPPAIKQKMLQDSVDQEMIKVFEIAFDIQPAAPPPGRPPRRNGRNLLRLHWNTISVRSVENTVWENDEVVPEEDLKELEELFAAKKPTATLKPSEKKKTNAAVPTGRKRPSTVSAKRENNVSIGLSQFKKKFTTYRDLAKAIDCADTVNLAGNKLQVLLTLLPAPEEKRDVQAQLDKLGEEEFMKDATNVESFFVAILSVSNFEAKVQGLLFMSQFMDHATDLRTKSNIVISASKQIQDSSRLKQLFKLILDIGNFMNGHNSEGFSLDSLLKLGETKAADRKTTVMDYLSTLAHRKGGDELITFDEDLPDVEAASKLIPNELTKETGRINKQFSDLEKLLEGEESTFATKMMESIENMKPEVEKLKKLNQQMQDIIKEAINYLGESDACTPQHMFMVIHKFIGLFADSRRKLRQKQKLKERQLRASKK